jgi:hypothetical protein
MCFGNAVQQIPLNIASQMQRRPSRWVFDATKVDLPVPERPPIAITGFLRIQIFKCSLASAAAACAFSVVSNCARSPDRRDSLYKHDVPISGVLQ